MRVFVTGATGFIGRHVLAELLARGHEPVCLIRPRRRAGEPGPERRGGSLRWVKGDLRDPASYREVLRSCQAVLHLAAADGEGAAGDGPPPARPGRPGPTELLLTASAQGPVERFLYVSALGAAPDSPFRLLRDKARIEGLLARPAPFARVVVRSSVVFGPGDRFVTSLERWLRRSPYAPDPAGVTLRAQPLFVEDLAASLCNLMEDSPAPFQLLEAGGPDVLSFADVVDLVGAAMGRPVRRIPLPPPLGRLFLRAAGLGLGGIHPRILPLFAAGATCSPGAFKARARLSVLLPFGPAIRRYVESI